jgi:hypothetical protein
MCNFSFSSSRAPGVALLSNSRVCGRACSARLPGAYNLFCTSAAAAKASQPTERPPRSTRPLTLESDANFLNQVSMRLSLALPALTYLGPARTATKAKTRPLFDLLTIVLRGTQPAPAISSSCGGTLCYRRHPLVRHYPSQASGAKRRSEVPQRTAPDTFITPHHPLQHPALRNPTTSSHSKDNTILDVFILKENARVYCCYTRR